MADRGTDPAELEAAAKELEALARLCAAQQKRGAEVGAGIPQLTQQVTAIIAGTSGSADTTMTGKLQTAGRQGKRAVAQLAQAQKVAHRLSAQARQQAAKARQEQAAANRSSGRR